MTSSTAAKKILQLIDLTSLNDNDNDAAIERLCEKARCSAGNVAAVCVYPQFIKTALLSLEKYGADNVKVATVVNFPAGGNDIETVVNDTQMAVESGANEVDLVFPYRAFLSGNTEVAASMISACKQICGKHVRLKVILETGVLRQPALIESACLLAISAGADFIKTSTGKVEINATLEAAEVIIRCIKASNNKQLGFKAAGGISSVEEAKKYLALAENIMGNEWVNASNFRFGASSLLNDVLKHLGLNTSSSASGY